MPESNSISFHCHPQEDRHCCRLAECCVEEGKYLTTCSDCQKQKHSELIESIRKPSEIIEEIRDGIGYDWDDPCGAHYCACSSNKYLLQAILQYLDNQHSKDERLND